MQHAWIIMLMLGLTSLWPFNATGQTKPLVVTDGLANLSFAEDDSVLLEGTWEFYPNKLLTPAEFETKDLPKSMFKVPGNWKGQATFGTYRLQFSSQAPHDELALYLGVIASSYRLWINGRAYGGRGHVTTQQSEQRGELGTSLFVFMPRPHNEILIQVSTASDFGGIIHVPRLGLAQPMIARHVLIGIVQGLLQGILLMIAIYHALLFLMRKRDRSHLFLAVGCLAIFLRDSTVGRIMILEEIFLTVPMNVHLTVQYLGAMFTTVGYFLFTHYLFPKAFRPWLVRTVMSLEMTALVLAIVLPTDVMDYAAYFHLVSSLLAITFGIWGVWQQVRQKEPYSLTFFIGITAFCFLAVVDLFLVRFWQSPAVSFISTASCVFSLFQAALLAQKNARAHRDLEQEQLKNRHAYQELSKLVYPHQIKLLKNGEILENTMPVGESEAIVLQFDIVDSSRLASATAKSFFEKIFTRTNEVIMRDYEPGTLIASGFRIKELGDGFLCSIGFPFAVPGSLSKEQLALRMAEEFVRIFLEEEAWLDHSEYGRLHCAIGIARGSIAGYFPQAGIKNYDLFGQGIILATRYEAVRKHLFDKMDPTVIIIVQHNVFEGLPLAEQKQRTPSYQVYDLKAADFQVRNDPGATYFYYCTMESLESRQSA